MRADRHLSAAELDAFGHELDALRQRATQGQQGSLLANAETAGNA